jgi:hypothetical protein
MKTNSSKTLIIYCDGQEQANQQRKVAKKRRRKAFPKILCALAPLRYSIQPFDDKFIM